MTLADVLDIVPSPWLKFVINGGFVAVTYAAWRIWNR